MRIIDMHGYYGRWPYAIREMTVSDIQATMEKLGVEKIVMASALSIQYDLAGGNAELSEVVSSYANVWGYVYVSGHYPELSLREMERYLPLKKFVGVKYHPELSRLAVDAAENEPIFDALEKHYRKVLLVHTWSLPEHNNPTCYSLPANALSLARRHPDLRIIMGHMGGPDWMSGIRAAMQADNIYLDYASSYCDRDKLAFAVKMLGADRIMYGGGLTEANPCTQLGALIDADISDQDKEKILYTNACNLFNM